MEPKIQRPEQLGLEHVFVPGSSRTTLLLLHGTGGDEHQLLELGRRLAPRASLLSPRGSVLEAGTTRRFFRRHSPTELDIPDLLERTDDLAAFVDDAVAASDLDPGRIVAVGYSNGANIAVSLLFRRPETLRAAVLFRPTVPYEPKQPLALAGKEVLLAAGRRDPLVSTAAAERLAELLRTGGATVAQRALDAGHELTVAETDDAAAWLRAIRCD